MAGRKQEFSDSIKVYVRVRPLISREFSTRECVTVAEREATVTLKDSDRHFSCKYDHVFTDSKGQDDVWNEMKDVVDNVIEGYNTTIFAYGQTGSGKTHTLFGPEVEEFKGPNKGIVPRAIHDLFSKISGSKKASVYCSFLQIYNEELFDLLRDPIMQYSLQIHEDARGDIFVDGLSQFRVKNTAEAMQLLDRGISYRATRSTVMNQASSRSHSVFQLLVEQRASETDSITVSKLNLVDLAGSEKWKPEAEMDKAHIAELQNINLSLHTLGRCIEALASGSTHVPFRESNLTRLLQDSFGGNTKTRLIAAMSPSEVNLNESISTLKFADRARNVMTTVHVNTSVEVSEAVVKRLQREVDHLRSMLNAAGISSTAAAGAGAAAVRSNVGGKASNDSLLGNLEADLFEAKEENIKLKKEIELLRINKHSSGPAVVEADPQASKLRQENKELLSILQEIQQVTRSFFAMTIEEDEMQAQLKTLYARVRLGGRGQSAPARSLGAVRIPGAGSPPLASLFASDPYFVAAGGPALAFRVKTSGRGPKGKLSGAVVGPKNRTGQVDEGGAVVEWQDSAEAAKKERAKKLKLEAKKLKNQKKMQEWRATKARREWEAIEAEEAAREEYAKQDLEKQKQYIARSKAAKKRLKALKARKDAEEEAERQRQGALTVD